MDKEADHVCQQAIIDGVAEPLMVVSKDYRVLLMNRAARETLSVVPSPSSDTRCYQISHRRESPCDGIDHPCPLQRVNESRKPVRVVHEHHLASGERRFFEVIAAPLWEADGKFQGIIETMHDITERKQAEEALQQYTERLRALTAQLTEVAESERQQLARELHDQVGQNLTVLGININIIKAQLPDNTPPEVRFRLDDSAVLVEQTAERIRDVMANLRPPVLDDYGLVAALRWYGDKFEKRTGIHIKIIGNEAVPRIAARVETVLFRIVQEALTNVAKHAKASQVLISMEADENDLLLIVSDDGIGFDNKQLAHPESYAGWGLITITERAEAVGGRCHVKSDPHAGTQVIVKVPR